MSLVRLLAAGKSLVGMRDTASPYRMNKHGMLPKFVSPKNPFAPAARPDAERGNVAVVQSHPQISLSCPSSATNLKKTQKLAFAAAPSQPEKKTGLVRSTPGFARRWVAWFREKSPLSFGAGVKPAPKPAATSFVREPVQCELSLDKVTVVRNDLSDADLEVVPAKPSVAKVNAEPVLQVTVKTEPTETPWGPAGEQNFGHAGNLIY